MEQTQAKRDCGTPLHLPPSLDTRDGGEELVDGANRGWPGVGEQFVEQLDGIVEAEASRADATGEEMDGRPCINLRVVWRLDRWGRSSACCGVEWTRVGIGTLPAAAALAGWAPGCQVPPGGGRPRRRDEQRRQGGGQEGVQVRSAARQTAMRAL
jgi:hypothetical protein